MTLDTSTPTTTPSPTTPMDPEALTPSSSTTSHLVLHTAFLLKRFAQTSVLPFLSNGQSARGFLNTLKREMPKVLDVRAYNRPTSMDQATTRIKRNVAFFKVTYGAVIVGVVVVFVLTNPTLFVALAVVAGLWSAFLAQGPDHVLKVGAVELKRNEKLMILGGATVVIVVFGGLISSGLYILFMSCAIIGAHGALREPVEVDPLDELEKEGEAIVKGEEV